MEKPLCCTCFKPKATLTCGLCSGDLCKNCAQFLPEDRFEYMVQKPAEAVHDTFCGPCFDANVAALVESYNQTMARAKEILVFTKTQNKETRYIKRLEDPLQVVDCHSREEVIMRLAFQAAERNFNGIIDVEVVSTKVRNGSYQTTRWTGSGIPAQVNADKLIRDRSFSTHPN